ncbi:type III PLP-dependent enzyme [Pseudothermotoga thermarum]|uniref:ornithine decarboxylase n=1 Tax=Pseudothermotoga thermarum DSM 5069 TaxID=688269 RepID=F7YV66_9THEM|nr:type III PLP-dependent enzyme [Pseudothermotoga thermarum]AEH50365.1 ornithine decarboxylase [Pseudothermotoga thermarum DSM 5069]
MEITDAVRKAAKTFETPFLIMDLDIVEQNYRKLQNAIPGCKIFYAVKANSHVRILERLRNLGSNFDVASIGEIKKLLELGVTPDRMIFANPMKREKDIAEAYRIGLRLFVADCPMELEKIAENAPGSQIVVRVAVENKHSDWPLSRKFGTDMLTAVDLLGYAQKLRLKPVGVSFHVGSQNYNPKSWSNAIENVAKIFYWVERNFGIELSILDIGGGIPVKHLKPIPTVEEIGQTVLQAVNEYLPNVRNLTIFAEPGRSMVGDAGILVSRVILRCQRGSEEWVYLDAGVFHGLMETIENFRYELVVEGKEEEKKMPFVLAGPTCDSVDKIYDDAMLPYNITLDDIVYFINAGAYTVEYGTNFNGIPSPKVYFVQDLT